MFVEIRRYRPRPEDRFSYNLRRLLARYRKRAAVARATANRFQTDAAIRAVFDVKNHRHIFQRRKAGDLQIRRAEVPIEEALSLRQKMI